MDILLGVTLLLLTLVYFVYRCLHPVDYQI